MTARDLMAEKSELRKAIRRKLKEISPADLAKWSDDLTARILELPEFRGARMVMAYLALAVEFQTARLIDAALEAGKAVCAPKVNWKTGRMYPVVLNGNDDFQLDSHGLKEPKGDQRVPVDQIDFILVPGLAFDVRGRRLGRGGGFYDKLLSRTDLHAGKIAAAFNLQILPKLPVAAHDQPVDMIVTPNRCMRFVRRTLAAPHGDEGRRRDDEKEQFMGMNF